MLEILGKWPFFRADMAGFGIYCMGGYDRIGVFRDGEITFKFKFGKIQILNHLKNYFF